MKGSLFYVTTSLSPAALLPTLTIVNSAASHTNTHTHCNSGGSDRICTHTSESKSHLCYSWQWVSQSIMVYCVRNVVAHGDAREGKWRGNWRMEWVASTLTRPQNMVYPALLTLMRTPRPPAVDWTDSPADLNGLVHLGERRNLVSAHVPSGSAWVLPSPYLSLCVYFGNLHIQCGLQAYNSVYTVYSFCHIP
jgi:hypothetical protein